MNAGGRTRSATSEASAPTKVARWPLAFAALALVALLSLPVWGPRTLAQLAFFRVRQVEVVGARYTPPTEIVERLAMDTARSVWQSLEPLAARVRGHPQIASVVVTRRLPGTIVVEIVERRPVALVVTPDGLRAVDERGVHLPLDPSRTPVDAPVVAATRRDTAVYHLLGAMQREAPRLFSRVTSVRVAAPGELLFHFADLPVRAMTSVSLARLSDIAPVERDLARRQLRPAELDLRYRDQVIARVP